MRAGIVGVGRMGLVLAGRLKEHVELTVFDRDPVRMEQVCEELGVLSAGSLEEIANTGIVILAVPDPEVISCIKEFNLMHKPLLVINIATNVARHALELAAAGPVRCVGAKFVGHAGEMALGLEPAIIVDDGPPEIIELVTGLLSPVGPVAIGRADVVSTINNIAGEKALEAAVLIEEELKRQGITDPRLVKGAIRQVAAGILKAYAEDDLGPFARQIVRVVRARMKTGGR